MVFVPHLPGPATVVRNPAHDGMDLLEVTPPVVQITVESRGSVSAVVGRDSSDFSFTVNNGYQQWQARVVNSPTDDVTMGVQLATGGHGDGGLTTFTVTEAALAAASPGEGTKIVKIFAQDWTGNWSA